jgi:hypothetical protein
MASRLVLLLAIALALVAAPTVFAAEKKEEKRE